MTILFLLNSIIMINSDFTVLEWQASVELKKEKNGTLVRQLEYNFSNLYQFDDDSYLLAPLSPFGNSILLKDLSLIDSWIQSEFFPSEDKNNLIYQQNKEIIDDLGSNVDSLKKDLLERFAISNTSDSNEISALDIDSIYSKLKKSKSHKKEKLAFMILLGEYLIEDNKEKNLKFGLLSIKQYLNPTIHLSLVDSKNNYLDLDHLLSSKYGYLKAVYYSKNIKRFKLSTSNDLMTIFKVFD